jgi:hypothetical protein
MSVLFAIEMMFCAIFIHAVYVKFLHKRTVLTIVTRGVVVLCAIYLPFSIYMSFNTYNRSYMYDYEGKRNYDVDRDALGDSMDMDIGNTGKSNLEKVDEVQLLDEVLDIVNSNRWSAYGASGLKRLYGGFDSYRVVSQAYFNVHLPFEPVLRDYSIKRDGFDSYDKRYEYKTLLFEYLEDENDLISLNLDATVNISNSKIFFIVNEDEEIVNLGITVEGNYMAIVLENDTNLRLHSYESVKEYYKENIGSIYIQK